MKTKLVINIYIHLKLSYLSKQQFRRVSDVAMYNVCLTLLLLHDFFIGK